MVPDGTRVRLSKRYSHDGFNTMLGAPWQPGHEGTVISSERGTITGRRIYTVSMHSPVKLIPKLSEVYVTEDEMEVVE